MNQSQQKILAAVISMLRATLGTMPPKQADKIVEEVVRILEALPSLL